MAEGNTSEPSIEEILASIRKIISDDDAEPDAQDQPKVAANVAEEAWPESNEEEDVLELTDVVSQEQHEAVEPFQAAINPEPEPVHEPEPTPVLPQAITMNHNESHSEPSPPEDGGIITERAMAAASGAFAKLHADEPEPRTSGDGRTVEDIARELLRPMLRQWMDQNLPQIVERLVERELRKISRKAEDM